MNLEELNSLINIRQYIAGNINNSAIDRQTVTMLTGMLLLVDKKILGFLQTPEFKEYIGYGDVRRAIEEVAQQNNIKSGLRRNPHTGQLEKIPR